MGVDEVEDELKRLEINSVSPIHRAEKKEELENFGKSIKERLKDKDDSISKIIW